MNSDEESDTHFCLKCQTTIMGLDNYVQHKTTVCPAKPRKPRHVCDDQGQTGQQSNVSVSESATSTAESHLSTHGINENEIARILSSLEQHTPATSTRGAVLDHRAKNPHSQVPVSERDVGNFLVFPEASSERAGGDNSNSETQDSPEVCESEMTNFLSSLELKSCKDVPEVSSQGELTKLLDSDLNDDHGLPISNLLTNLEFSSDSEPDLGEYLRDLDEEEERTTRSGAGKAWRNGQRPKEHGGKWKPWGRSRWGSSYPSASDRPKPSSGKWKAHRERHRVTSTGGKWKPDCWKTAEDKKEDRLQSHGKDGVEEDNAGCDYFAPPSAVAAVQRQSESPTTRSRTKTSPDTGKPSFSESSTGSSAPLQSSGASETQPPSSSVEERLSSTTNIQISSETEEIENTPVLSENREYENTASVDLAQKPLYRCSVCERNFSNRYILARHLITRMHINRTSNRPTEAIEMMEKYHNLVTRLSPFQCTICQFYCHSNKDLMTHLSGEEHEKLSENIVGPQFCVLCRFTTNESEELLEHCRSDVHETMVLSQSDHRPCVIREKRTAVNCPECDAVIASSKRLKSHRQTAHGTGKRGVKPRVNRTCEYCNKKFCSQIAMAIHVRRIHTKERPFECSVCEKSFTDKYSLADHEKTKLHFRNLHGASAAPTKESRKSLKRKNGHKCDHCDFIATDYAALRPHYLTAHANMSIACKLCGLDFVTGSALNIHKKSKRHIRMEEAEKLGTVVSCDLCPRNFVDTDRMTLHRLTHEEVHAQRNPAVDHNQHVEFLKSIPATTKKVNCPACSMEISRANIASHLRRHAQILPFSCTVCEARFTNTIALRRHLKVHMGLYNKKCPECNKVFLNRSSYSSHIAVHNKPESEYVRCQLCPMSFTHQWKLNQHYKNKHDDKNLHCTYVGCSMSFVRRTDLTTHLRTHTDEKPFLCDLCGYRGRTKLCLHRHQRVHTSERSFSCEHCPYKAKNYSHLRRHIRIHIGCKPYKCPYCSYTCNTHENIRKHIQNTRKHAGKHVYPCQVEMCSFGTSSAKEFRSHLQTVHPGHAGTICSVFTGVYRKDEDTTVPEEGAQVLPTRERHVARRRHRRTKLDSTDLDTASQSVDSADVAEDTAQSEVEPVAEASSSEIVMDEGQAVPGEMIEVEIVNPSGEEVELTAESINVLVQQALLNQPGFYNVGMDNVIPQLKVVSVPEGVTLQFEPE